jgi:hypothetical protein
MQLGEFDEKKAREQAKAFLSKSIFTLSHLINVDHTGIRESTVNPFETSNPSYAAFECLKSEVLAFKKIKDLENEQR